MLRRRGLLWPGLGVARDRYGVGCARHVHALPGNIGLIAVHFQLSDLRYFETNSLVNLITILVAIVSGRCIEVAT
jgi:hypothetical protein